MLVSGFTVIRNAEIMGYPVVQSIRSILPLVDEFVIGVGQSDDNTRQLLLSIGDPKIKIFDSVWNTQKTSGGLILSEKTNEALDRCKGIWCFYLQADEVVHEEDLPKIRDAMEKFEHNKDVEGLLFSYVHFYGHYGVIATARNWYRNEVRVVRRESGIRSVGDAQGFRVGERKPRVIHCGASIYHYGWVKPPEKMGEKNKHMFRWWHGNKYDEAFNNFAYKSSYGLKSFSGSHPKVMQDLVAKAGWTWTPRKDRIDWETRDYKNFFSDVFEKLTGRRFGEHKNYVLVKADRG